MSDRNNDQELEKTTDATADEATSETETNDAIESVPADSMQFSVTFDDVDDEGTVDDGIYSALASAETGETDETNEAEADAIASANASAEVTERNAARVNETLRLAKTDHKDALAEHAEPQGKASEPTMTLASRIDRVLVGGGSDDILLKTYPTFALNKVTVAGPKGKVNILDGANFFCYSGHAYALLISDDPDSGITRIRAMLGISTLRKLSALTVDVEHGTITFDTGKQPQTGIANFMLKDNIPYLWLELNGIPAMMHWDTGMNAKPRLSGKFYAEHASSLPELGPVRKGSEITAAGAAEYRYHALGGICAKIGSREVILPEVRVVFDTEDMHTAEVPGYDGQMNNIVDVRRIRIDFENMCVTME